MDTFSLQRDLDRVLALASARDLDTIIKAHRIDGEPHPYADLIRASTRALKLQEDTFIQHLQDDPEAPYFVASLAKLDTARIEAFIDKLFLEVEALEPGLWRALGIPGSPRNMAEIHEKIFAALEEPLTDEDLGRLSSIYVDTWNALDTLLAIYGYYIPVASQVRQRAERVFAGASLTSVEETDPGDPTRYDPDVVSVFPDYLDDADTWKKIYYKILEMLAEIPGPHAYGLQGYDVICAAASVGLIRMNVHAPITRLFGINKNVPARQPTERSIEREIEYHHYKEELKEFKVTL